MAIILMYMYLFVQNWPAYLIHVHTCMITIQRGLVHCCTKKFACCAEVSFMWRLYYTVRNVIGILNAVSYMYMCKW